MSDHRPDAQGASFFFSVLMPRHQPSLADARQREALRDAMRTLRRNLPFELDAWVLMPDHFHCLWHLRSGDEDAGRCELWLKRLVTRTLAAEFHVGEAGSRAPLRLSPQEARKALARAGELGGQWPGRFWEHRIGSEADYDAHLDYIHLDPLRHGLVKTVADWPYSTFHRHVLAGRYSPDWGGEGSAGPAYGFDE